ncbi:MAG: hypothetical protein J0M34_01350 [Alphaproteobacteria bacterium]|nr:hypothetical protein [Alphaproteobacteria bacterium]
MHTPKKYYALIAALAVTFTMPAYEAEASMLSKLKKKVTQSVIKTLPKPLQKTATKLDAARNKGHAAVRGAHLKIAKQKFDVYKDAAKFKQKVHIDGLKLKKQLVEHKSKTVRKMASDGAEHKLGVMRNLEQTHRQGVMTRAGIATVGAIAPIAGHAAGGLIGTGAGLAGGAIGTTVGTAGGVAPIVAVGPSGSIGGKPVAPTQLPGVKGVLAGKPAPLTPQVLPDVPTLVGSTNGGEVSTSAAPPVIPQKGELAGKPDPNAVKGEQEIASADTVARTDDNLQGSKVYCVFNCGGRPYVEINQH